MKPHQSDYEKFEQLKDDSVSLSRQWLETSDEPTLKALVSDYQNIVERQRQIINQQTGGIEAILEVMAVELMMDESLGR